MPETCHQPICLIASLFWHSFWSSRPVDGNSGRKKLGWTTAYNWIFYVGGGLCHLAVLLISAGNLHLLYKTLKLSLPIVILLSECLATTAMPVAARLPSPSPLQPTARHATTVEVHGAFCGAFCQHFGARTVKWPRIHLSVSARAQNGESLRCERMRGVKYPAEGSYTFYSRATARE